MIDVVKKVIKRDGKIEEFQRDKLENVIFRSIMDVEKHSEGEAVYNELALFRAKKVTDFVIARIMELHVKDAKNPIHIETIQDCVEQTLIANWMIEHGESYMLYREGRAKVRNGEITKEQFCRTGVNLDKFKETYLWNIAHECDTIPKLNSWARGTDGKNFGELVTLCEERYEGEIDDAATKILARPEVRIVIVAGPSSSGKTTTTRKIEMRLQKHGYSFKTLNLDNYFYDLKDQPKDKFGDVDYETPAALNYPLINQHLEELLAGKAIKSPYYDFKKGESVPEQIEVSLGPQEILLLDCLHGLYPEMTAAVSEEKKFKLYIEQMNVVRNIAYQFTRWTDVRLLRRMLRDSVHRNHPLDATLGHWHYVRKGELKYILPYINSVDTIVNGGLAYELPILKTVVSDHFPNPRQFRKDNRMDAYVRGVRVKRLLETVEAYTDLSVVPGDSHLREFIGGSTLQIMHN